MSDISPFQQALAADAASSGVRSAALFLHALDPNDRHWVLSQLEATQRAEIEGLLDELGLVGMPADRAIVAAALSVPANGEAHDMCGSPIGREAALRVLPGETICRLLAGEPDGLIAALLHRRDWPWQESLLEQVGAVRRHRILSALRAAAGHAWSSRRTRFDEALMQGILRRAARTASLAAVEPTAPRFRALFASVHRCLHRVAARIHVRATS